MVDVYYKEEKSCSLQSPADAETYIRWETEVCRLKREDFRYENRN